MQSYAPPQDPYRISRTSTSHGILSAPVSGSVDSYSYENGRYWYQLNAVMEDGRSWALCRFYEDFYDFQIALLDEFKEEAGRTGQPRILPYMPGPVTYVTDTISSARCQSLDDYIKKLLSMPSYISHCRLVKLLFAPRPGDVETTGRFGDHRQSSGSHQSSDSSLEQSRQSSAHAMNGNGYPAHQHTRASTQQQPQHTRMASNGSGLHMRTPSDLQPPRMQRHDTAMSANSGNSQTNPSQFLKIKIEYDGELIAVRLPQDVTYNQLLEKLQERISLGGNGVTRIQYKDELTRQFLDIYGDRDLSHAILRNPKLKLIVS